MKKVFYAGVTGIVIYEIASVYFITPLPGSQNLNSIELAYFLQSWRWVFRIILWVLVLAGGAAVVNKKPIWFPLAMLVMALGITYATHYIMSADKMFYQPVRLEHEISEESVVHQDRLVLGIYENGEAKAYPIQYLGYHHQVRDVIGGKSVMVTYCTACRTGRVYEPLINNREEVFTLVGMDHFNALFEDATTGSWWRQVNGEAVTGVLKGQRLQEFPSIQTSLGQWLKMYPDSRIMQPDPRFQDEYDLLSKYENGWGSTGLTTRDSVSWRDKSWVVGVKIGKDTKALDWNQLLRERLVETTVGRTPVLVALGSDNGSFFAFKRNTPADRFTLRNDTLYCRGEAYNLLGKNVKLSAKGLEMVSAYQEFWHSWRTFNPATERY
ncbi:hypothetical protein DYBT9275_00663 [Dyadobacter sp. CECT 9275]|uniref:DUF3179 domain-containing protein n=1 Tax=Dyadobacter helix TaxID=2822344 RepID=A0A916J7V9_9BACT|nr:DUF3179 domain-containing (seleno)protein [Dyadobacter sp. CECT 9275]CAG4991035.1 hypothetical protein DYBT9275_00663 [Dyadobacter sp. CECT 9275]